jgi:hypothetical protein
MHISEKEAVLTMAEYQWFKKKYPKLITFLEEREGIFFIGNNVYVDFMRENITALSEKKARYYIYERLKDSHLSKNFIESITNWIKWYYKPDPQIQVRYDNLNQPIAISLLDPKQERFEIPIPTPK